MYKDGKILVAKNGDKEFYILPKLANRHGLIAGGTGSGKTITLKVMAESFSNAGVPVFLADVKGDLAGTCKEGLSSEDINKRLENMNIKDFEFEKFHVHFFDIDREYGLPIRITVSNFGPILFSHILSLNNTQRDILNIIFKIADDNRLLLLDLKDLKSLLDFVENNLKVIVKTYGSITKASIQAIKRSMLSIESEGLDRLFGEPEIDVNDIIKIAEDGKGYINILHSSNLVLNERVYSAFMLWFLSTIYESMPEVGDLDKPKLVFFFDEAHLLFKNCDAILLKRIDQMTKLIRSKGIGLYFVTQDPTDINDTILQQLGNKVQHVHRSYTAKDKKNHKAIADSFRENKDLNISEVLENLGTGEAIVSFLDEKGIPNIAEKVSILPPQSKIGTIEKDERDEYIKKSSLYSKYFNDIERESAYEILSKNMLKFNDVDEEDEKVTKSKKTKTFESEISKSVKNVMKSTGSSVGREIARSLIESVFKNNTKAKNIAGNVGSSIGRNLLGTFFNLKK